MKGYIPMQTMTIRSIQQKTSQRGTTFWNVELGTPDGSTLLATIWDSDVRQALGNLTRANVELERNAKGYAKITAVSPAASAPPAGMPSMVGASPVMAYRYLALDAVAKLFQGAGIRSGDAIEYAEALVHWLEHGPISDDPDDDEPGDDWSHDDGEIPF